MAWVGTLERGGGTTAPVCGRLVELGQSLTFGREGQVPLGVGDPAVSRLALRVTLTEPGWQIAATNTNGVIVRPWAHPGDRWGTATRTVRVQRLAVGVIGSKDTEHWVLLEDPEQLPVRAVPAGAGAAAPTESIKPPPPLTETQLEALAALFPEHLAWPPQVSPMARTVAQAARRCNIAEASLQNRLEKVREKAFTLGQVQVRESTDPAYLAPLAANGYLSALAPWLGDVPAAAQPGAGSGPGT